MISIFTPTFNRANKIYRVFDSLINQTYKDFEWVIIDDGSKDNIEEVIFDFKKKSDFPIQFYKFEINKGKHIATNKALELANGQFFVVADSDDAFTFDALEFFMNGWKSILESEKNNFIGIRACCNDQFGHRISDSIKNEPLDCTMAEAFYSHNFRKESWTMVCTDWHREFLFPQNHIGYFPEGIIWKAMTRDKKLRFFNKATRVYYVEEENSLMRTNLPAQKKVTRTLVNVIDVLNNDLNYFWNYPSYFFKSFILFYCYFFYLNGFKYFKNLNTISKMLIVLLLPFGVIIHSIFRIYNLSRQ